MPVDRRFFDTLMAGKKLSMRALAARMGKTHSQLSLMFSGQRRMQLDEAVQLSEILGAPLHRIAEAAGVGMVRANGRRVEVIGAMNGRGVVELYPAGVIERVTSPDASLPEDLIAVQARTADTPNAWMDGWVVFCMRSTEIEPDAVGRFCLARIKGGDTVLATVRRGYREGTYNLSGPVSADSVRLEWATPVLLARM
ncbi:MAG TPA: helix-turn-helix transcriptional regulator [Pseudomonas sp.]|nr:helix-turn-helix transcriptional regulator [Pseudomonas sp.]